MQYDYALADEHAALFRTEVFMGAMCKLNSAVMSLIADSPSTLGETFHQHAQKTGAPAALVQLADELQATEFMAPEGDIDPYARAQYARLLMKETSLRTAFGAQVIEPRQLAGVAIPEGAITTDVMDALRALKLPNLAMVAEFHVR